MALVTGTSGNDFIHVAGDGLTAPGGYNDIPDATNSNDAIHAGAGDDIIYTGTGNDTVFGESGNDTIIFTTGSAFTPADAIDGGGGNDTLVLQGTSVNNGARAIFNIVNVETLKLEGSGNDLIQLNDTAVAAGKTMTIDASGKTANFAFFDGSAETDGHFRIIVGGQETQVYGGALSDTLDATGGQHFAIFNGEAGNDVALFSGNFNQLKVGSNFDEPSVDGGAGYDIVRVDGDYSAKSTLNGAGANIVNVEEMRFAPGFDYNFATLDSVVAAGQTFTVRGSALAAGDALLWDGSAEKDGSFVLLGGAGADSLIGGAQNDTVDGHAGDDLLNLTAGGVDTVAGGNGNDRIDFGATLTATDQVSGGSGTDELILNGDYSAGLALGASTITSVEVITLEHGFSYALTENDANVANGATLTVDGSALGAANSLTFDGSAESRGHFVLLGGVGNDTLTGGAMGDTFDGGAGNDVFNMQLGGTDTADGGGGNDVFNLGAALHASDHIDGGSGSDTLNIDGDYSARTLFNGDTFTDIETLHLAGGNDYYLVFSNGNVLAGQVMTVDASGLGAGDTLRLIADSMTFGRLDIIGGAGDDHIAGGNALNTFFGGLGADLMKGGAGRDTYVYTSVAESTGTTHDIIQNLDPTERDAIQLPFLPKAYLGEIDGGTLSQATFDADLATLANAGALAANDAAVFAPTSGDDAGRFYLVVDANGVAGYQADQDYVIQLGVGSSDATINFR